MSDTNSTIPAVSLAVSATDEPTWLTEKRRTSLESFNASPLPRRGLHLWRYTDPARFLAENPAEPANGNVKQPDQGEKTLRSLVDDKHLAALVTDNDGSHISGYGLDALASKGIIVGSLAEASRENEKVASRMYELVNSSTGKFEALNGALWRDGIFVYVPRGVTLTEPIYLRRLMNETTSSQYLRLLVLAEENSELTLIDDYTGGRDDSADSPSRTNAAVELFGGPSSRVRYITMQNMANGSRSYLTHRASIDRGATMLTVPLMFGGAECKQNYGIILSGEGAESTIVGLQFARDHQHFDTHTLHHHTANNTLSNIELKVVLRDKANSAYTGLIRIEKKAAGCQAYQTNRNLLLNSGCKAETIPELEILNEDVSCSHGATVGPVDPESVFYLKCRGIPQNEAVRMIVAGFIESTLKMVPKDLQKTVRDIVAIRLRNM